MLHTDMADYRRADEPDLLDGLRRHDPLALAEAYHRTVAASHACARRVLSSSAGVEALLRAVYAELWDAPPPNHEPLEGWVRARCFRLGSKDLRERGAAPASPSLAALLPDLPAPDVRYLDAAERALAELEEDARTALLSAHDQGVPAAAQNNPEASAALERALIELGGDGENAAGVDDDCADLGPLGDWTLGLVGGEQAARIATAVSNRPGCTNRARTLRRGRRRLEGLPPTPDMGQRILVTVLAARPSAIVPGSAVAPAAAASSGSPQPTATTPPSVAEPLDSALDDHDDAPLSAMLAEAETVEAEAPSADSALTTEDETTTDAGEEAVPAPTPEPYEPGPYEEEQGSSIGRKILYGLGLIVLLALGAVVGLYVGQLITG